MPRAPKAGKKKTGQSAELEPVMEAAQPEAGSWPPLKVRPPTTKPSRSPTRGPAWFVTLLDFIERATSRATSVREHLAVFVTYAVAIFLIVGVTAGIAAVAFVKIASAGTWPGITMIGIAAASLGGGLFIKRARQGSGTGPASDDEATGDAPKE